MRGPGVAAEEPARSGLRAAIVAHLDSHRVSRVIYGTVIGLALVTALEVHPPTAAQTTALLLSTAVAVALAELYSDMVGTRIRLRRALGARRRREILQDVASVAAGAGLPAVFFLLAVVGVFELDTAFAIAKWSGLGLLGVYGFLAARLSGAHVAQAAMWAVGVGAIGAFVIVLKSLVH